VDHDPLVVPGRQAAGASIGVAALGAASVGAAARERVVVVVLVVAAAPLGAHEVHGAIRDEWQRLGWERSFLRYPVSDEGDTPGGRVSFFEGGKIEWTPAGGAVTTRSVKFDDD